MRRRRHDLHPRKGQASASLQTWRAQIPAWPAENPDLRFEEQVCRERRRSADERPRMFARGRDAEGRWAKARGDRDKSAFSAQLLSEIPNPELAKARDAYHHLASRGWALF